MGFFDAKIVCGICGEEVGLNRFNVKKSDVWLCPKCLKKAGGAGKVNVGKVTIGEIKEMISTNEGKDNQLSDKLVNQSLQTAEGMYHYCVENNYGTGWNENWGVKHFKVIENNLMNVEEVIMTFIGFHNYQSASKHDQNFAYAITNKRIVMAQKNIIAGETLQTISLENINDITFKSGIILGVMTIDTIKEVFNVGLGKQSAQKINAKVIEVLETLKIKKSQGIKDAAATVSAADEIKKYKELLDMNVITQEEFETKKKQLLGM